MTNCNGGTGTTLPVIPNCYSTSSQAINKVNCGTTPSELPVLVNPGDVSNQVLVPILADVIQNCVCLSKYEPAFPTNLIVTTNLLKAPATGSVQTVPSGRICINNVSYSYTCLGVPGTVAVDQTVTPPIVNGTIGSTPIILTGITPSSSVIETGNTSATPIHNDFTAVIKTPTVCCDQVAQSYVQNKLIVRGVSFATCNLSVTVRGTIGEQEFTGTVGFADTTTSTLVTGIIPFDNLIRLEELSFPEEFNFAGVIPLPTNTRMTIHENYDTCLIVDCVRANTANYDVLHDPTTATDEGVVDTSNFANFLVAADLSFVINKTTHATVSQKLAVMTNAGSQVICSDGTTTLPTCPQANPCTNNTVPCPDPVTTT